MEQRNGSNRTIIILAILLVLALIATGYYWNKSNTLGAANTTLNEEVSVLSELRNDLVADIENLQSEYDELIESNDSLEVLYKETTKIVQTQKVEIKKITKTYANDAAGMKAEIEQLRTIKQDLTMVITDLKAEITKLKDSNAALTVLVANETAKGKEMEVKIDALKQLNSSLERSNKSLMASSTRASNLRVDILKKNDKSTTSARRAREIEVSFDVKQLPENKKGEHSVYLVLRDAKGVPVKVDNPISVSVKSNNGGNVEEIIAQQEMVATLFDGVRLQFKVNPASGALKKGYYRALVYTDWGMLGGVEFQLK